MVTHTLMAMSVGDSNSLGQCCCGTVSRSGISGTQDKPSSSTLPVFAGMFHADSGTYPRMFVSWVLPCPAYFEVSAETDDGDWRFYSSWKGSLLDWIQVA